MLKVLSYYSRAEATFFQFIKDESVTTLPTVTGTSSEYFQRVLYLKSPTKLHLVGSKGDGSGYLDCLEPDELVGLSHFTRPALSEDEQEQLKDVLQTFLDSYSSIKHDKVSKLVSVAKRCFELNTDKLQFYSFFKKFCAFNPKTIQTTDSQFSKDLWFNILERLESILYPSMKFVDSASLSHFQLKSHYSALCLEGVHEESFRYMYRPTQAGLSKCADILNKELGLSIQVLDEEDLMQTIESYKSSDTPGLFGVVVCSKQSEHVIPMLFSKTLNTLVTLDSSTTDLVLDIPDVNVQSISSQRLADHFSCGIDAMVILKYSLMILKHTDGDLSDLFIDPSNREVWRLPPFFNVITQRRFSSLTADLESKRNQFKNPVKTSAGFACLCETCVPNETGNCGTRGDIVSNEILELDTNRSEVNINLFMYAQGLHAYAAVMHPSTARKDA